MATPALYPTLVTHLHRSPVRHYAEHRSYSWYVDVDELPQLPWWVRPFARFEAADHFDGPTGFSLGLLHGYETECELIARVRLREQWPDVKSVAKKTRLE